MGIFVTVFFGNRDYTLKLMVGKFDENRLVTVFPKIVTKNYANVTFDHDLK